MGQRKGQPSVFRIITLFVLLAIIGLSFVPLLDINYRPSRQGKSITVYYQWYGTAPEIIEREVTAKLEGTLSTVRGITSIYSESYFGGGYITLRFDEMKEVQTIRLEVATLVRQVASEFPAGVSYPVINMGGGGERDKTLTTYTLSGNYSPLELQEYGEEVIRKELSGVKGVKDVWAYGAQPIEWVMSYEWNKLSALSLGPKDLAVAVASYLQESPLGLATCYRSDGNIGKTGVFLKPAASSQIDWNRIPVKKIGDRIIYLTSVCTVEKRAQLPQSYYRINGLNSVNIVVTAGEEVNELVVGKAVKESMKTVTRKLPEGMSITTVYDSTEHLQKELFSILWRIALSVVMLVLFIWFTSRSLRYIFVVVTAIVINIAIAFIFLYIFRVEVQLYSLAGLTISLGIIIDNAIVMVDHLRHHGNKRVFLALMAATLTTIGALSVIYLIDEEQQLQLLDFGYVLAINLFVSLFVALYLVPALVEKTGVAKKVTGRFLRRKRRIVAFGKGYLRLLRFLLRFRVAVLIIFILGFGLPFYLLPEKIETKKTGSEAHQIVWYIHWYNSTLGSDWYKENLHPSLTKWLGGALHLFYKNVYASSYYGDPKRTVLHLNGKMPSGSNIHQMNEVFTELENFLSQFDEVQQFHTRINGIRDASIAIYFRPEYEFTAFPYYLKARLTEKAIYLGGLDCSIYGVGRGFNNAVYNGYKNTSLYLYGYNYEMLLDHAEALKDKLLAYDRIKEVDILGAINYAGQPNFEYYLEIDAFDLALKDVQLEALHNFLADINIDERPVWRGQIGGKLANLKIKPKEAGLLDVWNVKNYPVSFTDSALIKLAGMSEITRRKASQRIVRENQQYRIILSFDYIGSWNLKKRVIDRFVAENNVLMPVGYFIKEQRGGWWWGENSRQYWLIGVVIAIVFCIGATLLESLVQPLIVVFIIPVSFIGVFLTFYLFDLNFDYGGYASFIMLSGIAVNSGFFIINDYNNLRKQNLSLPRPRLYLKAFHLKIIPILLTVCSTVAALFPFLVDGKEQVFWFALAAGTVGGLLFSLMGVFFLLPMILGKNSFVKYNRQ